MGTPKSLVEALADLFVGSRSGETTITDLLTDERINIVDRLDLAERVLLRSQSSDTAWIIADLVLPEWIAQGFNRDAESLRARFPSVERLAKEV